MFAWKKLAVVYNKILVYIVKRFHGPNHRHISLIKKLFSLWSKELIRSVSSIIHKNVCSTNASFKFFGHVCTFCTGSHKLCPRSNLFLGCKSIRMKTQSDFLCANRKFSISLSRFIQNQSCLKENSATGKWLGSGKIWSLLHSDKKEKKKRRRRKPGLNKKIGYA